MSRVLRRRLTLVHVIVVDVERSAHARTYLRPRKGHGRALRILLILIIDDIHVLVQRTIILALLVQDFLFLVGFYCVLLYSIT